MRIATLLAPPLCLLAPLLLLGACGPDNGGYDTAPPADAPAASAEAPSVPPTPAWAGDFNLIGTEPFWGVEIRPAGLTLTAPDAQPVIVANPGPTAEGEAGVWATPAFIVRLTRGECSDGMSDRTYPYVAVVTTADRGELRGCGAPPRDFSEARP